MSTIEELQKLSEREDHVEFKKADTIIRLQEGRRQIPATVGIGC